MTSESRTREENWTGKERLYRHINRMGVGAKEYLDTDATFRASYTLIATVISLVEMAMEDEDVHPQVIRNVLDKVIYSSVSPGQMAQLEISREQLLLAVKEMERASNPIVVGNIKP